MWHFGTFWDISLVIVKLRVLELPRSGGKIFSKVSHFVTFCNISLVIVKLWRWGNPFRRMAAHV